MNTFGFVVSILLYGKKYDLTLRKKYDMDWFAWEIGKSFKASVGFKAVSNSHLVGSNTVDSRQNQSCSRSGFMQCGYKCVANALGEVH